MSKEQDIQAGKMEWKKEAPNKIGYWVRLNAIHRPVVHHVIEDIDGDLAINWGWSGETTIVKIKDIPSKIEYFYWCLLPNLPERISYKNTTPPPINR